MNNPQAPTRKAEGVPPKMIEDLRRQAKNGGLTLDFEIGNARCTILDGTAAVGGPYTHGQSIQAFLDGHRIGWHKGNDEGKEAGKKEAQTEAQKPGAKRQLYVMKTGMTYHVFIMVGSQWVRVEHAKNPAFSPGPVIDAAIEAFKLTEFDVLMVDRTAELQPAS